MTHDRRSSDDHAVATALTTPQARSEDWTEPRTMPAASDPKRALAEWLWPLVGLVLLGAFLASIVDDYPLRTLIAAK